MIITLHVNGLNLFLKDWIIFFPHSAASACQRYNCSRYNPWISISLVPAKGIYKYTTLYCDFCKL